MQGILKTNKKFLSIAMIFTMLISMFSSTFGIQASASTSTDLVKWDMIAAPSDADIQATGGDLKEGAVLNNSQGKTPSYSTGSLSINGWNEGADTKYWELSFSTKGYEEITLSAKQRSSSTGPRDFKIVYSADNGETWNDVEGSEYQVTGTALSNYMPTVFLPEEVANLENVQVRFIMTTNTSSGGAMVSPTGTSNINNIVITGTPVINDSIVQAVKATPGAGVVKVGTKVELMTETEGATIVYTINGSDEQEYNGEEGIVLKELPATITTQATKEGLTSSVKSTFNYTQHKVQNVTASPNGGAVTVGKKVTLSTKTEDATIRYSMDNGTTWNDYTSEITLTELPATIVAYGTAEGSLDSAHATFTFTEKENEGYNVYYGQLHSHTTNSDGLGSLDDAYSYAKEKVDFLAVTDHSNSFDNDTVSSMGDGSKSEKWNNGQAAAKKYTDSTFVGLYAGEMTWSNGIGHINTFNTPGFESRNKAEYKAADALQTYYNKLKEFPNSISQLNHPGPTFGDFNDFAHYDKEADAVISLIEVGNGEGPVRGSGYFPSYEFYQRALDKGWHVSPTNNQDNHKGLWGDANTARTVILADSLTKENVYDALRNRRTYATEDSNLEIKYTLNGEVMGSILDETPSNVDIKVEVKDTDETIGKVSVVTSGGKVVATKTVDTKEAVVSFDLPADYSYYYIRVEQNDKDIAVTAPVWVGEVEKAGISKTTPSTTLPIKGEEISITTDFFNNESTTLELTSLEYAINGKVIHEATDLKNIASLSTGNYKFAYTPDKAGKFNVDVKLVAKLNGVERIYTDVLKLDVIDPAIVTKVLIDGTHFNDYVAGYYANNMGNFTKIANEQNVAVNIETKEITDEMLEDVALFVITAPAKKAGTANGVTYEPQSFSDEFIQMVKRYVDKGGNIIVCGIASYQDGSGDFTTSTQVNRLLEGIGATSRLNKDQAVDDDNKVNNQNFRLAFNTYNMESPYLQGVIADKQNYSFYSGCTVALDAAAVEAGKATWLVRGHDTTYSNNPKETGTPVIVPKGEVVALAAETLSGGGTMFIGGTVYISDFEVKAALDNYTDLQYANYNISLNILEDVKKEVAVTAIKDVRNAELGEVFAVEGIVTAGTKEPNAFFDTIYIQDETGGINIFPVGGMDIQVGQKVKVIGSVDEYQGEIELIVIDIEVTDTNKTPLDPTVLTAKEAMDAKNGGQLIRVEGTVKEIKPGTSILVEDETGVARVFVDGYIGSSSGDKTALTDRIKVGDYIEAVGLGSVDPEGARLRVRDTDEVKTIATTNNVTINILHTNDTHGRVIGDNSIIGIDTVANMKKQMNNAILVDDGDTLHGLPFVTMNKGADIVNLMNAAGYDFMTAGNHDFNYGYERLLELNKQANFPIMGANVVKDGKNILDANDIKEIDGVKVGFFGLSSPETAYKTNPNNIVGVTFADPIETAKQQVASLQAQGADIIIALAHIGVDESTEVTSEDISKAVEGIDVIIDGHSHTTFENGFEGANDTLIASTGEYLGNVGHVSVTIDTTTKELVSKQASLISKAQSAEYGADEVLTAKINEIKAEQDEVLSTVIGTTTVDLNGEREYVRTQETNIGNLITDAMLAETNADIAITNGGGIRASIATGNITKGNVISVLPFGNFVVTKKLTGAQIKDVLEHGVKDAPNAAGSFAHVAGLNVVYDQEQPAGSRIVKITMDGQDLDMNKEYLVATNDFLAAGGDAYPAFGDVKTENEFNALDEVLADYIAEKGTVSPIVEGRIVIGKAVVEEDNGAAEGEGDDPVVIPTPEVTPPPAVEGEGDNPVIMPTLPEGEDNTETPDGETTPPTSDEEDETPENDSESTTPDQEDSENENPETGDGMPIAACAAIFVLAGAAFYARRKSA